MRARKKASGRIYYYLDQGKRADGRRTELPLGADYIEALRRYSEAEINATGPALTLGGALRRWQTETLPGRPINTQKDVLWSLPRLLKFFDNPPVEFEKVEPQHIKQYLRWRKDSPVRANREVAWLSAAWNWAREEGLTKTANPCAGVRRHRETARDVYVEDAEFDLLYEHGGEPLRNAMDVAYLLGLRPIDVLLIQETDIRNGALEVTPSKTRHRTGRKLRFEIEDGGELDNLIRRVRARKAAFSVKSLALLINEKGQALTKSMLRRRFEDARAAAAKAIGNEQLAAKIRLIQFRDLRAKAGTDKADSAGDIRQAQKQLGHSSVTMTETYVRARRGEKLKPTR